MSVTQFPVRWLVLLLSTFLTSVPASVPAAAFAFALSCPRMGFPATSKLDVKSAFRTRYLMC